MLEMIARGAQVLLAIGAAYLLALWFVLVVWTYRDIEGRSRSVLTQVFSTLLVVLFFLPGVLLYLILRPKTTLDQAFQRSLEEEYLLQDLEELPRCPGCHRHVQDDYVLCPHCQSSLREACAHCSRLIDLRWSVCPYCGTPQRGEPDRVPRVEAPAARWVAPGARRRRLPDGSRDEVAAGSEAGATRLVPRRPADAALVSDEQGRTASADRASAKTVVRPLDRFRGRTGAFATAADRAEDGGDGGSSAASGANDREAGRSAVAGWPGSDDASIGGRLLRSMGAFQALGGNGSAKGRRGAPEDVAANGSDLGPERSEVDAAPVRAVPPNAGDE